MAEFRLVGTVHIDHPSEVERQRGAKSRVYLTLDRGLKGGRLDEIPLSEDDLLNLAAAATRVLVTLRTQRNEQT